MNIEERAAQAAAWKATGQCNCAQAVMKAFEDKLPVDADTLMKLGAGYAAGMGCMEFMISQAYSSTLRECGETVQPMKAGVTAVLVNLVFNYLLIYGKFGFPELGVQGAAIATVLSRYVEAAIIIIWSHTTQKKCLLPKVFTVL